MLASVGESASGSSFGGSEPRAAQEGGPGSTAPQTVYRLHPSRAEDYPAVSSVVRPMLLFYTDNIATPVRPLDDHNRLALESALPEAPPSCVTPCACLPQDVIVLATSPAHSLRTSTTRATRGFGSSEGSLDGASSPAGSSISELGASCDVEESAADDEAGPDRSSPPLGPTVVDRLDSAHYEVRPAGLVERQDSAHEVNASAPCRRKADF